MSIPEIIQIPIDKSGQLYLNSIPSKSLIDYIKVLNHSTTVQQWNIDNIGLLVKVATSNINTNMGIDHLFTEDVTTTKNSILMKLNITIRHALSNIFTQFTVPHYFKHENIKPVSMIAVQSGGVNNVLDNNIMFALLVSSFLCYIFRYHTPLVLSRPVLDNTVFQADDTHPLQMDKLSVDPIPHPRSMPMQMDKLSVDPIPHPRSMPMQMDKLSVDPIPHPPSMRMPYHTKLNWRRSKVVLGEVDSDEGRDTPRRTVMLITVVSNRFQCFVKFSNNPYYIDDYIFESNIYDYFRSVRYSEDTHYDRSISENVINFHGSNLVKKSGNLLPINIELNDGDDVKCKIDLRYTRYLDKRNQFIYLCTEYDPEFSIFLNVINSSSVSRIFNGYYTIVEVLGRLNNTFRFYHGDLHSGNIMVNSDCTRCKFFDFDMSGLYGEEEFANNDVITSFSRDTPSYNRLIKLHLSNCEWSRNFYFFMDSYRLLISILFRFLPDIVFIRENPDYFNKTITNSIISFRPIDIIEEIYKFPEWIHFMETDTESINFNNFAIYLHNSGKYNDVYNKYYHNIKRIEFIFNTLFT